MTRDKLCAILETLTVLAIHTATDYSLTPEEQYDIISRDIETCVDAVCDTLQQTIKPSSN